ncbi:MAG TPA: HNH endonuclease signature motif containing protein [Saprospiraceae bacterium]|nr:HNH endonuclease signature motif containing protein [Saprospiraceae bacterium]
MNTYPNLVYRKGRQSHSRIKKEYIKWREDQNPPLPMRCDLPECYFYKNPCIWNGKELNLILDHIDGVAGDNRPENLRFLCPNCNSQQVTNGGGNKGRVIMDEGGYSIKGEGGKRFYNLPIEPANLKLRVGKAKSGLCRSPDGDDNPRRV